MASQINASNSGFGGIVSTGDSSGVLELQAAGTTIAAITSTGMAVTGTLSSSGVSTFVAGTAAAPAITTTGDTNTGMFFPAADTIAFAEGGAEAMRLNSVGYVGIGTTSPQSFLDINAGSSGVPTYTGTVRIGGHSAQSLASIGGLEFLATNFSSGYGWRLCGIDLGGGSVPFVFQTRQNSSTWTEAMRIDQNGGLILVGSTAQKATGTTWSNPSDQRLKDNIRDYTKGTTELMQVRVREWEYNGKGNTTEGMKGLGVVADEVMTVLPDTVETYDAKLNADDEKTTEIKKFDATEITWLLVKTVQEQQTIINDLKARIEALEAK